MFFSLKPSLIINIKFFIIYQEKMWPDTFIPTTCLREMAHENKHSSLFRIEL